MRACASCGLEEGPPPADLRPYGPGGSLICYPCGKKDPETTEANMALAIEMASAAGGGVAVLTNEGPQPFDGDPTTLEP